MFSFIRKLNSTKIHDFFTSSYHKTLKFLGIEHDRNLDTYLKGILFWLIRKRVMREIIPEGGGKIAPPPIFGRGLKCEQN